MDHSLPLRLTCGTLRTLAVSVSALLHFDFDCFWFRNRRFREMHFQHSVTKVRRHFRSIGIWAQREAASEGAIGSLDPMEFSFLLFLFGFALAEN